MWREEDKTVVVLFLFPVLLSFNVVSGRACGNRECMHALAILIQISTLIVTGYR